MIRTAEIELKDGRKLEVDVEVGDQQQEKVPEKQSLANQFGIEGKIAQRPSMLGELLKNPPTLETLKQHPFQTPLKAMGAGFEAAEAPVASAGLALQRGNPSEIAPDMLKSFSGQRPAELGDIYRGVGTPEPIAALGGLLATGAKGMPTEMLGGIIGKGVGKGAELMKLPLLAERFGKPFISKSLSVLSGVPEEQVMKALDNPHLLNPKQYEKASKDADLVYKDKIEPVIRNTGNRVKTTVKEMDDVLKDIQTTVGGEETRTLASMNPEQKKKFLDILDRVKNRPDMSLNELDATMGEIDNELHSMWSVKERGKEKALSTYEALLTKVRSGLKNVRNAQYSQLEPHFEYISTIRDMAKVTKSFSRIWPSFMRGISIYELSAMFGFPLPGRGVAVAATSPFVQGKAIEAGSAIGETIAKHPTLPIMGAKKAVE